MTPRPRLFALLSVLLAIASASSRATAASASDSGIWQSHGPNGARVLHLADSPSNPNVLYAGTSGAGVWRTTDSGAHWTYASNGLTGGASATVQALAVDPSNAQHVVAGMQSGLFVSSDGGAGWTPVIDDGVGFSAVAFDPTDNQRLYAGGGAVYASADGGGTWKPRATGALYSVVALVVDPVDPSHVYAGLDCGGIYESSDYGHHWTQGNLQDVCRVNALAIDPADPQHLYAGTYYGLYETTNRGSSWSATSLRTGVLSLAIDQVDPSTIYAGTDHGLNRSTNGGRDWSKVFTPDLSPGVPSVAVAAGKVAPVFVGTDQGVFVMAAPGQPFVESNTGMNASGMLAVAVDRFHPTVYAGGFGLFRSRDNGATWERAHGRLKGCVIVDIAVDPSNSVDAYVATLGCGILRSTDGGAMWRRANVGLTLEGYDVVSSRSLAVDQLAPSRLYAAVEFSGEAGEFGRVFVSNDRGAHWKPTSLGKAETTYVVAVAPSRSQIVYAGVTYGDTSQPVVLRSTNGGSKWTFTALVDESVNSLAVSPVNARNVYAAVGFDGVRVTNDSGSTWSSASEGIGSGQIVKTVAVDPAHPSTLYAGVAEGCCPDGLGVYRSTNAASSWSAFDEGLTNLHVWDLAISPGGTTVHAATDGGGVFEYRY